MWPSQIVDPAVCNNDKVLRAGKEGQLLVYYFGDHMFGWYPRETHGLKDFVEHYENFSVPKAGKTKLFQTALDEAEAEKNDLGATARRWKQSLTDEQIRSRKQAAAAAETSKSSTAVKKEAKPKHAALPKEPKAAVKSAPEPERTGFDVFRSNIGASLDINELSVYQEMWDAMAADRKQYYDDLARSGDKKEVAKKGGKASAPCAPPRKPPGAFQLYSAANKNLIRELGLSQKEFKVYMQGEWESATAAARAPFEREAMEKMNVYQSKRTEWILANPEAGAALSDKDDDVAADAFSVGEAEPLPEDDPRNHDYCEQCGRGGELICCDGCPASYHPKCLPIPKLLADLPDHWFCHVCSASRGNAVDQKASTTDTKQKVSVFSGTVVSPVQQRPDMKRERNADEETVVKRAKSGSEASNGGKGRSHDGDSNVSRQSSDNGARNGDDSKSGWGSGTSSGAASWQRDTREPEAATPRLPESPRYPPNSRLFISGVNCGMTERDLALEIKKFGKIAEQFRFKPGAAYVHVQMTTSEDAHRAMTGLKNFRFREREPPLNVKIADPRPVSGSDRAKAEPPTVAAAASNVSDKLLPGMSKSEVDAVLHRLGFDRNAACLRDVRLLRDELNDLMRSYDQQCSDLTNMRSNAAAKMEEEKNHELRSQPRLKEASIRRHYDDLKRRLDIEVEDKREQDRKAHRNAQTNWKRKRQSILGAHQVPCFIDQALPSRDMWTTIDHAWSYLDRCAPPSEPRREPPRIPVQELRPTMHSYHVHDQTLYDDPNANKGPPLHLYNDRLPLPPHYDDRLPRPPQRERAPAEWSDPARNPVPGYPANPAVAPRPPYPPSLPYIGPGSAPFYQPPPQDTLGIPPPPMQRPFRPEGYPNSRAQAAPQPVFGSDDIVAALAQLEGLMPPPAMPAAAAMPPVLSDVDYNDVYSILQND